MTRLGWTDRPPAGTLGGMKSRLLTSLVVTLSAGGWAVSTFGSNAVDVEPTNRPAPIMEAEVIATDLRAPWSIAFTPDSRAMVTERVGRVRLIEDGALRDEPMLVVPDIKSWSKMGLLGIAIDPNFADNAFVYLAECHGQGEDNWLRVRRYVERDGKLVEPTTLIDKIPAFHNHAGGRLRFGPDGKLYITTGDADRPPLAQDLTSLAGKILRLNPDGSVPNDNPFVDQPDARPEIWSLGHRNSQGLAFQPGTNALYAPEHGPNGGDELNLVLPGHNYGWPTISHDRAADGMDQPLLEFTPSIGPANATFYDGELFPNLRGHLLIAALRGEALIRVPVDGEKLGRPERLLHGTTGRIREVVVAPDGSIWITTSEFDPPEGREMDRFDQIVRLSPGKGYVETPDRPDNVRTLPVAEGPAAVFTQSCVACHGDRVRNSLQPSLFDNEWHYGDTDAAIARNIRDGLPSRGMPAYGEQLSDDDISKLVAYIRQRSNPNRSGGDESEGNDAH